MFPVKDLCDICALCDASSMASATCTYTYIHVNAMRIKFFRKVEHRWLICGSVCVTTKLLFNMLHAYFLCDRKNSPVVMSMKNTDNSHKKNKRITESV